MGSINKKFYATESVLIDRYSKTVTPHPTNLTYDGGKIYTVLKFNMTEIKSSLAQAPSYAKIVLNLCPQITSNAPDIGCVYTKWSESTMKYDNAVGVGTVIYRKTTNPSYQKNVYFGIALEANDVVNGTGLTLFNMYMDTSAPSGVFYPVNSEYTPYITFEWEDVSISNFTVSNADNTIYSDTAITLQGEHITSWDVYVNGNYACSNTYVIPQNKMYVGENNIYVVAKDSYGGITTSATVKITLKTIKPTITNLTIQNEGNLIDNATTLTWQSTNQDYFNVYSNDILLYTVSSNVQMCVIAKGKLKTGSNRIRVEVYNKGTDKNSTDVSAYINGTITLSRITPSVNNITLSDTNIDNMITISCSASNYSTLEYYQDSTILGTTTAKSLQIKEGTLKPNKSNIKVIATYNSGFDTITAQNDISVALTENTPIIYNLEPSGLNRNIDEIVAATFKTNEFCDRWELKANDNYTSIGTMERKVAYGANSFNKGINTLTLTIYYSPIWSNGSVVRTCSKTVTFNGYGAPDAPVLNINELYSTATPSIEWEVNEEQIAYEYILLNGLEQIKSESISSAVNRLTLGDLEDKTEYTIKVRIKNKYELYSRYSEATFSTLFNSILLPDFYIIEGTNSVQITINGYQESTFKSISIYRKDGFNDWLEIANNCNIEDSVTDYTLPCGTEIKYKLRVFNAEGAYKDTEEKTIKISLMNYWLTNIEDLTQSYKMDFVQSSYGFNRNIVYKQYTNQAAPRIFKGKVLYNTVNLSVSFSNQEAFRFINFIETANDYNVFCYRTWKGEKLFVSVIVKDMKPINNQVMEVSLTLTEINFHESKMYTGSGYRKLVYLNGEYFLDGSIDLSGYDNSIIQVVK